MADADGKVIALCLPLYDGPTPRTYMSVLTLVSSWHEIAPWGWKLKPLPFVGAPVDRTRNRLARLAKAHLVRLNEPKPDPESWRGMREGVADTLRENSVRWSHEYEGIGRPLILDAVDRVLRERTTTGAPADVYLWADADCYFEEPEDYIRLVKALLDLPEEVGVLAVPLSIQGPRGPNGLNAKPLAPAERVMFDGTIQEVEWVGTGIVAVRASVFDRVKWPWFRFRYEERPDEVAKYLASDPLEPGAPEMGGEDMVFCEKVRQAGMKVCVATHLIGVHNFRRAYTVLDEASEVKRQKEQGW